MKRVKQTVNDKASVVEDNVDNDVGDNDSTSSDQSVSSEKIDVEFEAFGLCDDDIDGIGQLLKQLFLNATVNVFELAEILTGQTGIGCIFKTVEDDDVPVEEEDNDVYGVVSILDLKENQAKPCVQQMTSMLQKRLQQQIDGKKLDEKCRQHFDDLLFNFSPNRVGFLVNERVINLPHHIALPAFENLLREIRDSGRTFEHYLMILKIHKQIGLASASASASGNSVKKGIKRKRKNVASSDGEHANLSILYANAEEEFLSDECQTYFDYDVSNESESEEGGFKSYRRVVLFDQSTLNKFVDKLSNDVKSSCE